jgi:hypothetical protein
LIVNKEDRVSRERLWCRLLIVKDVAIERPSFGGDWRHYSAQLLAHDRDASDRRRCGGHRRLGSLHSGIVRSILRLQIGSGSRQQREPSLVHLLQYLNPLRNVRIGRGKGIVELTGDL